jgi:prephenate dehydratase
MNAKLQAAVQSVSFGAWLKIDLLPYPTIKSLFSAIEAGEVDHIVVPISNSTNGSVAQTLELIAARSSKEKLEVIGETRVVVRHCLVGHRIEHTNSNFVPRSDHDRPDHAEKRLELSHITSIHTHPQAWTQCSPFLNENFDASVARINEDSTSAAAELAAKDKTGKSAAICSELAAKLLEVDILAKDIQETNSNKTRFLVFRQISQSAVDHDSNYSSSINELPKESLYVWRLSQESSKQEIMALMQPSETVSMNYFTWEDSDKKNKWVYLFLAGLKEQRMNYVNQLKKQLSPISSEWRCWGEWTVGDDEMVIS